MQHNPDTIKRTLDIIETLSEEHKAQYETSFGDEDYKPVEWDSNIIIKLVEENVYHLASGAFSICFTDKKYV